MNLPACQEALNGLRSFIPVKSTVQFGEQQIIPRSNKLIMSGHLLLISNAMCPSQAFNIKQLRSESTESLAAEEGAALTMGSTGKRSVSAYSQKSSSRHRSNSTSMYPMPSIPEYPGYQNLKPTKCLPVRLYSRPILNISSWKGNAISQKYDNTVAIHSLVQWSLAGLAGDYTFQSSNKNTGQFRDQSLEEYFNERLMKLKYCNIQAPRP
ncbi:uncharacterized protein LOC119966959 [Scyliorhinus canicula]|uniref:uncharacterized protein LOC119966959 n=1 Tax=Scyliorhinus canicula TaxID=7830 RepID=UPI0018F3DFB6|nr:uncharacterized protein LOC119966959 [Scyliorhinus canicula]